MFLYWRYYQVPACRASTSNAFWAPASIRYCQFLHNFFSCTFDSRRRTPIFVCITANFFTTFLLAPLSSASVALAREIFIDISVELLQRMLPWTASLDNLWRIKFLGLVASIPYFARPWLPAGVAYWIVGCSKQIICFAVGNIDSFSLRLAKTLRCSLLAQEIFKVYFISTNLNRY